MFNFFKKNNVPSAELKDKSLDYGLTRSVLAYEVARTDGDISNEELSILIEEIKKISTKVTKDHTEILNIIEKSSSENISFHEYIVGVNKNFSKDEKINLIQFMWEIAYSDGHLDVNEERLIRRVADLIMLKNIEVLKAKDNVKNS